MKKIIYAVWLLSLGVFVSCGETEEEENNQPAATNQPLFDKPLENAQTTDSSNRLDLTTAPFNAFQMGDIIFQTTGGRLMLPLQQATGNNFTHCAMVVVGKNGNVFVLEAFDSVMRTPIDVWIKRGVGGKYAVLRLKQSSTRLNESAQVKIKHQAKNYLGLPYDSYYGWSDDKMYCSELVYKLMNAAGVVLCKQKPLKEYDLSSPAVQRALQEVYNGNIPYNEQMVSPGDIFGSDQLEKVYAN